MVNQLLSGIKIEQRFIKNVIESSNNIVPKFTTLTISNNLWVEFQEVHSFWTQGFESPPTQGQDAFTQFIKFGKI